MKLKKFISLAMLILLVIATLNTSAMAAGSNVAANATITASSEYNEEYAAALCVHENPAEWDDGTEWATAGEANPWIKFEWAEPVWIGQIIIADRSNPADWAIHVEITYSDGSSYVTGELDNDGEPYTINFEPKNVTWVQMNITESEGPNLGLGRVSIYDVDAPAVPEPEPEPVVEEAAPVLVVVAPAPVAPAPVAAPQTGVTSLAVLGMLGSAVIFGAVRSRKRK